MPIINSVIASGPAPTGTKQITNNGTHDVAAYEYADVQVPTTAPAYYIEKAVDANGKLVNSSQIMDFTGVTDMSDYALYYAYYNNSSITGTLSFPDLTSITGQYAMYNTFKSCTRITSVIMDALVSVTGSYCLSSTFYGSNFTTLDLSSLASVSGDNAMRDFCGNNKSITTANLPSLKTISGNYSCREMFIDCSNLASCYLPVLETVSGTQSMVFFLLRTKIPTANFPSLLVVNGSTTMSSCIREISTLTSVNMPKLVTLNGDKCFEAGLSYNSALPSVVLPSLKNMPSSWVMQNCFQNDTSLLSVSLPALTTTSFGSYTNQFNRMLIGCTGVTVHFPSNLQSVIGSWADVTGGFNGTNTTVLFDLPATVILTGANTTEYERSPKDDTQTALAWRVKDTGTITEPIIDWTPFYTNGTTDPQVGDTIYSDAACTTAVTTISSIA